MKVLLLGGTAEARRLAGALALAGVDGVFSYAGRTDAPAVQALPMRVGGFGGVAGLAGYLRAEGITHVVDATHAFAARMSFNAVAACEVAGVPLIALERPAWVAQAGDDWLSVPDQAAALAALPDEPARVFLAIGRQGIAGFAVRPEHFYLLRLVDAPRGPLPLANAQFVLGRGPFAVEDDLALLRQHRIELVVAKNSGGEGGRAKLKAARVMGLKVVMIDRPMAPERRVAAAVEEVLVWLGHAADRGV